MSEFLQRCTSLKRGVNEKIIVSTITGNAKEDTTIFSIHFFTVL